MAELLERLCAEHGIAPVPQLEWSTRMRRLLGRAYMDRNLLRLSGWLSKAQADDTLRHELAHIAVGPGWRRAPHGARWREWASRLGANPRATAHSAPAEAPARSDARRYWGLECPACGVRVARMRVLRGLYHRGCGSRKGKLVRMLRDTREQVLRWAAEAGAPPEA